MEASLKVQRRGSKITYEANLPTHTYDEDGGYVTSCPLLKLSAQGDTRDESKNAFLEALDMFIVSTVRKNTIATVLADLGWYKPEPHKYAVHIEETRVAVTA